MQDTGQTNRFQAHRYCRKSKSSVLMQIKDFSFLMYVVQSVLFSDSLNARIMERIHSDTV